MIGSARARIMPRPVRPGETVAVVSPSAPGISRWPHRVENGTRYLEGLGLRIRVMPNASRGGDFPWLSASAEARAEDINAAFADSSVSVVLSAIGGNHSVQLLPYLDFELIRSHPKVFQGYSDVTVLHWAILKHAGLSTLYGPSFLLGLAEHPQVLDYTDRYLRQAWFGTDPLLFTAAPTWTDELLHFDQRADLTRARRLNYNSGWLRVRGGQAQGPLVVGCLETVCSVLSGSVGWLELDGAILALEPSDATRSASVIDGHLSTLEHLGVFDQLAALVFGRPARLENVEMVWQVIERRTRSARLPVLANVDFGHTDPTLTLPIGLPAFVDVDGLVFRVERRLSASQEWGT